MSAATTRAATADEEHPGWNDVTPDEVREAHAAFAAAEAGLDGTNSGELVRLRDAAAATLAVLDDAHRQGIAVAPEHAGLRERAEETLARAPEALAAPAELLPVREDALKRLAAVAPPPEHGHPPPPAADERGDRGASAGSHPAGSNGGPPVPPPAPRHGRVAEDTETPSDDTPEGETTVRDEDGNEVDEDLLAFVCKKTGLPIIHVLHCGDGSFDVELKYGGGIARVPLGDSGGIYSPRRFEKSISNRCTGLAVSTYYAEKRWRPIATALIRLGEGDRSGSTEAEETRAWIASYLVQFGVREIKLADPAALLRTLRTTGEEEPLRDEEERLYLSVIPLVQHVARNIGSRTTMPDLTGRLARLGFRPYRLQPKHGGETARRRTRRSEPGFEVDAP